MSLGLPDHLARETSSRALASGAHAAGLVALCFALLNIVITAITSGDGSHYLALVAVLPMAALILVLNRRRTVGTSVLYLTVGSLSTYFYTWALLKQTPSYHDTALFVFALPVIAMSLVGGAGSGALIGVLWCSLGFALAEVMVWIAAVATDRTYTPNAVSMTAYLLAVAVLLVEAMSRRGRRRSQSAIYRAIRRGQLLRFRRELAVESAAELHDNTISELIAIASAAPGRLRPSLRARIEADLEALGRDRVGESTGSTGLPGGLLEPGSDLAQAIELARDEGLSITVTGNTEALARVSEARRHALGLAVRQCLLNVLRHSGTTSAEVAVEASGPELTLLVVDTGHGFVVDGVDANRLGLRHSVQDRLARVGGRAMVWSAPGEGTTVMLTVPCRDVDESVSDELRAGDAPTRDDRSRDSRSRDSQSRDSQSRDSQSRGDQSHGDPEPAS